MIDYARVMLEKSEKNLEEGMEYFDGRADFAFYMFNTKKKEMQKIVRLLL